MHPFYETNTSLCISFYFVCIKCRAFLLLRLHFHLPQPLSPLPLSLPLIPHRCPRPRGRRVQGLLHHRHDIGGVLGCTTHPQPPQEPGEAKHLPQAPQVGVVLEAAARFDEKTPRAEQEVQLCEESAAGERQDERLEVISDSVRNSCWFYA